MSDKPAKSPAGSKPPAEAKPPTGAKTTAGKKEKGVVSSNTPMDRKIAKHRARRYGQNQDKAAAAAAADADADADADAEMEGAGADHDHASTEAGPSSSNTTDIPVDPALRALYPSSSAVYALQPPAPGAKAGDAAIPLKLCVKSNYPSPSPSRYPDPSASTQSSGPYFLPTPSKPHRKLLVEDSGRRLGIIEKGDPEPAQTTAAPIFTLPQLAGFDPAANTPSQLPTGIDPNSPFFNQRDQFPFAPEGVSKEVHDGVIKELSKSQAEYATKSRSLAEALAANTRLERTVAELEAANATAVEKFNEVLARNEKLAEEVNNIEPGLREDVQRILDEGNKDILKWQEEANDAEQVKANYKDWLQRLQDAPDTQTLGRRLMSINNEATDENTKLRKDAKELRMLAKELETTISNKNDAIATKDQALLDYRATNNRLRDEVKKFQASSEKFEKESDELKTVCEEQFMMSFADKDASGESDDAMHDEFENTDAALFKKPARPARTREQLWEELEQSQEDIVTWSMDLNEERKRTAQLEREKNDLVKQVQLLTGHAEELREKITKKDQEITTKSEELQAWAGSIGGTSQPAEPHDQQVAGLRQEVGRLTQELANAEQRAKDGRTELETQANGAVNERDVRIKQLEADRDGKADVIAQHERRIGELDSQVADRERAMNNAQVNHAELERKAKETVEQYEKHFKEMQDESSGKDRAIEQHVLRIRELESDVSSKDELTAQHERSRADGDEPMQGSAGPDGQIASLTAEIETLRGQVTEHEATIAKHKADVEEARPEWERLNEFEAKVKAEQAQQKEGDDLNAQLIATLKTELALKDTKLQAHEGSLTDQEAKRKEAEELKDRHIKSLETQLETKDTNLKAYEDSLREEEAKRNDAEARKDRAVEQYDGQTRHVDALEKDLTEANAAKTDLETRVADMQSRHKTELDEARQDEQRAADEVVNLLDEKKKMKEEIQRLNDTIRSNNSNINERRKMMVTAKSHIEQKSKDADRAEFEAKTYKTKLASLEMVHQKLQDDDAHRQEELGRISEAYEAEKAAVEEVKKLMEDMTSRLTAMDELQAQVDKCKRYHDDWLVSASEIRAGEQPARANRGENLGAALGKELDDSEDVVEAEPLSVGPVHTVLDQPDYAPLLTLTQTAVQTVLNQPASSQPLTLAQTVVDQLGRQQPPALTRTSMYTVLDQPDVVEPLTQTAVHTTLDQPDVVEPLTQTSVHTILDQHDSSPDLTQSPQLTRAPVRTLVNQVPQRVLPRFEDLAIRPPSFSQSDTIAVQTSPVEAVLAPATSPAPEHELSLSNMRTVLNVSPVEAVAAPTTTAPSSGTGKRTGRAVKTIYKHTTTNEIPTRTWMSIVLILLLAVVQTALTYRERQVWLSANDETQSLLWETIAGHRREATFFPAVRALVGSALGLSDLEMAEARSLLY